MSLFAQCRRTERQGLRAAYHSRFLTMNMECLTFSSGLSSNPIQTHVHPPLIPHAEAGARPACLPIRLGSSRASAAIIPTLGEQQKITTPHPGRRREHCPPRLAPACHSAFMDRSVVSTIYFRPSSSTIFSFLPKNDLLMDLMKISCTSSSITGSYWTS